MSRWSEKKARAFLDAAAHERAGGPGMSDTTLARISALQDPEAHRSRDAFEDALLRAGWRERRIRRAIAQVTAPSAFALWTRSQRDALLTFAGGALASALLADSALDGLRTFGGFCLGAACVAMFRAVRGGR